MVSRPSPNITSLQSKIISCRRCPRLVQWREEIAKKKTKRFAEWNYWGKPVPSFGDPDARLLVVGLAPAAHGGNRTGRIFTGDESGNWLYRALYKAGFASQPFSTGRDDGMRLMGCYISAACHCAPPQNKLLRKEIVNCRPFMLRELQLLKNLHVIVGLGKLGFDAVFDSVRELGWTNLKPRPRFGHDVRYRLDDTLTLLGCYHPSQQNTFTGRLTETMLDTVFRTASRILGDA
jgi:uracil-DNA glycosylase family 4